MWWPQQEGGTLVNRPKLQSKVTVIVALSHLAGPCSHETALKPAPAPVENFMDHAERETLSLPLLPHLSALASIDPTPRADTQYGKTP